MVDSDGRIICNKCSKEITEEIILYEALFRCVSKFAVSVYNKENTIVRGNRFIIVKHYHEDCVDLHKEATSALYNNSTTST